MKKTFTTLFCQAALSLSFIVTARAETTDKTYLVKPEKIKWSKRNPVSLCNDLIIKPKFAMTGEGANLNLLLTFQDQEYALQNSSTEPGKATFQLAEAPATGKDSTTIEVTGAFEGDQYIGTARVQIKKDHSIVSPKDAGQKGKKKWVPPKYDCDVAYNFKAKPTTVKK